MGEDAGAPAPRPAVRALVERDGRSLLLGADWSDGRRWLLPGGGVESGEAPRAALECEVREETGLTVAVGEPVGCFAFAHRSLGYHVVNTVFAARAPECEVSSDHLPAEEGVATAEWVPEGAVLDRELAPGERRFFSRYLDGA